MSKPAITKIHSLGKNERLKSRKTITKLFSSGAHFSCFPVRVLFLLSPGGEQPLQAGFSVSSKRFKKAVDRNRIKRLLREAYRLQKKVLQDLLNNQTQQLSVFFIYTGKELPEYALLSEKMAAAITILANKIKTPPKNS